MVGIPLLIHRESQSARAGLRSYDYSTLATANPYLSSKSMLPMKEPVVGGKDNHCVLVYPLSLEFIHNVFACLVNLSDQGVVTFHRVLI